MKIFINTDNQPPTLSASILTRTDEDGVLRAYSSSTGGSLAQLVFKRDTSVPLEVVVVGSAVTAESVARLKFGLKPKGRYDDVLAVLVSAEGAGEETANGIGRRFFLTPTFSGAAIDAALRVGNGAEDDLAAADFIAEFAWENASGEVSASATIPTSIQNNVIRAGDEACGSVAGEWLALMVLRLPYAEYCALVEAGQDDPENVLYVCPDAPSEVADHDVSPSAHAQQFSQILSEFDARTEENENRLTDYLDSAKQAFEDASRELSESLDDHSVAIENRLNNGATSTQAGTVRLSTDAVLSGGAPIGKKGDGQIVADISAEQTARTSADNTLSAEVDRVSRELAAARKIADGAALLDVVFEATTESEECADAPDSADWRAYLGTLGQYVGEGVAGLLRVREITFWRRRGATPFGGTPLYLRLHRNIGSRWTKVLESTNAVRMNSQTEQDRPCTPWTMAPVAGQEANALIPADETILLTVAGATGFDAREVGFGTIVDASRTGGIASANTLNWNSAEPAETMQVAPKLRIRYSTEATRLTLAEIIAHVKGAQTPGA